MANIPTIHLFYILLHIKRQSYVHLNKNLWTTRFIENTLAINSLYKQT